jgi:hypothetical protein
MPKGRVTTSVANRGGKLGFDPAIDSGIEDVKRERSAGQDLIMKSLEVELGT